MVGIKHHTPAGGRGVKIAKSSYNEEHDAGTIADVLTDHNLAAHTALGLAVEGTANATTLDGIDSTGFVQVANHTKAAHDALNIDADTLDDKHKNAFASAGHTHTGLLKTNLLLLWDKNNGDIPEDYTEIMELTGTSFTVIKYIGGEIEMTNLTHSTKTVAGANVTVTFKDYQSTTQISAVNQTLYAPFTSLADKPVTVNIANATGAPITYTILASDPENGDPLAQLSVTVADSSNQDSIFSLPKQSYITVASA